MHDLPVSVPAFHGRRRLHGLNVGAVDLKTFFLPCGESPVFTVVESQRRASVVPLSRADDENGETMVVTVA